MSNHLELIHTADNDPKWHMPYTPAIKVHSARPYTLPESLRHRCITAIPILRPNLTIFPLMLAAGRAGGGKFAPGITGSGRRPQPCGPALPFYCGHGETSGCHQPVLARYFGDIGPPAPQWK